MPGIDRLVSDTFSIKLKKELEKDQIKALERKIFRERGLSIKLAVDDFSIISDSMKSIGIRNSIIRDIFREIFTIKHPRGHDYSLEIVDEQLAERVFKIIADEKCFVILRFLMNNIASNEKIIKLTNISKTSSYRKINMLLLTGLITIVSKEQIKTRFFINFVSIFKKISFVVDENRIRIIMIIPERIYKKSTVKDFI